MHDIQWNESLNLGIARIDEQHRELLRIINAWIRAVAKNKGPRAEDNVVRRLRQYTVHHFHDEEEFMRERDYPKLYEHHHEHERLKQRVKEYQRTMYLKGRVDARDLRDFLKEWLIGHILGFDLNIARYVRERQ